MSERVDRRWGWWRVLAEGDALTSIFKSKKRWKAKLLSIQPGKSISKQYHLKREEKWIIIQGNGTIEIEGFEDYRGDYINGDMFEVYRGQIHKITNTDEELDTIILELQYGDETEEDDIVRLEKIDEKDGK